MGKDINVIIGENVRRYRLENNWTQKNFKEMLNLSPASTYVSVLENGRTNSTLKRVKQLADLLGVKVIDLVEDWEDEDL